MTVFDVKIIISAFSIVQKDSSLLLLLFFCKDLLTESVASSHKFYICFSQLKTFSCHFGSISFKVIP